MKITLLVISSRDLWVTLQWPFALIPFLLCTRTYSTSISSSTVGENNTQRKTILHTCTYNVLFLYTYSHCKKFDCCN